MQSSTLAELMSLAAEGDSQSLQHFYSKLLSSQLFVPERLPGQASHQAQYPNQFLNLLAVNEGERTIVPVFSLPDLAQHWSDRELSGRLLSATQLFELTPKEWWIALDPGSETSKELSPWEIEQLRGGPQSIAALVAELSSDTWNDLEVLAVSDEESHELKGMLREFGQSHGEVEALYLARERRHSMDGTSKDGLVVGAAVSNAKYVETIQRQLQSACDLHSVGSDSIRVLCGTSQNSLMLGIFKGLPPFYQQSGIRKFLTPLTKLLRIFSKSH